MPAKTAVAAAISAPLLAIATLAAVAGAIAAQPDSTSTSKCSPGVDAGIGTSSAATDTENLTAVRLASAQIIAKVGVNMGMPMPGETIAIATAAQESDLQNLDYGDRDTLGLFQQRASQGWGTPAQIMNPRYAARQSYIQLLQVPGWRSISTTAAAQAVQRSAFPDAYEKWSGEAAALAAKFTGTVACTPADSGDNTVAAAAVNAAGYRIKGDGTLPDHQYAGSNIDDELHWLTQLSKAFTQVEIQALAAHHPAD